MPQLAAAKQCAVQTLVALHGSQAAYEEVKCLADLSAGLKVRKYWNGQLLLCSKLSECLHKRACRVPGALAANGTAQQPDSL